MEYTEREAERLFEEAYNYHMLGDIDKAIELYKQSIDIQPTAKAYTFLGWAYSMKKDYEKAIEYCKRAIEIDPDFGNPYNDIGAYLIEQGKFEEAIPWLKQAALAKNYEPRHFPHINLARAYMAMGKLYDALREAEEAIRIEKDYKPAHVIRHQILGMLN
ncbi:tetratricopeptide repeat protein [Hydrogenivirga sp.]